jgi:hypothetical protein
MDLQRVATAAPGGLVDHVWAYGSPSTHRGNRVFPNGRHGAAANDVNMLVCTGGRQRSAVEFRDLYTAAGFRLTHIVPTMATSCVTEGVKARGS